MSKEEKLISFEDLKKDLIRREIDRKFIELIKLVTEKNGQTKENT